MCRGRLDKQRTCKIKFAHGPVDPNPRSGRNSDERWVAVAYSTNEERGWILRVIGFVEDEPTTRHFFVSTSMVCTQPYAIIPVPMFSLDSLCKGVLTGHVPVDPNKVLKFISRLFF
jgi:hypothetical protein